MASTDGRMSKPGQCKYTPDKYVGFVVQIPEGLLGSAMLSD
jgi:hypothetical protein